MVSPITQASTALTLGTFTTGSIVGSGDTQAYTFAGTQGQVVYYDGLSADTNIQVDLTSPSGAAVPLYSTYEFTIGAGGDGTPVALPETGTYTLTVSGASGATGKFAFELLDASANASSPKPLPLNDTTVNGSFNVAGATIAQSNESTNLYSFTGTAGQLLHFHSLTDTSGYNANWTLYGPTGQNVASSNLNTDFEATLPEAGTYVLAVSNNDSSNTTSKDSYSFAVYTPATTTGTLVYGTTYNGNIKNLGDSYTYTFSGKTGQTLDFDGLTGPTNNTTIYAVLTDPLGGTVPNLYAISVNSDSGPFTLTQSGTYTLTITGHPFSYYGFATGAFSFRLLDNALSSATPPGQATALTLDPNATVTGSFGTASIPANTSTNLYTFSATAGQSVYFHDLTSSSPAFTTSWTLYGPANAARRERLLAGRFGGRQPARDRHVHLGDCGQRFFEHGDQRHV